MSAARQNKRRDLIQIFAFKQIDSFLSSKKLQLRWKFSCGSFQMISQSHLIIYLYSSIVSNQMKIEKWMNELSRMSDDRWMIKISEKSLSEMKICSFMFQFSFLIAFHVFFIGVYFLYLCNHDVVDVKGRKSERKKTTKMKHFKIDFSSCWYLRNAFICQWFEHGSRKERHGKFWFFWKINHVKMWMKKLKYKIVVKKKDKTDLQIFLR